MRSITKGHSVEYSVKATTLGVDFNVSGGSSKIGAVKTDISPHQTSSPWTKLDIPPAFSLTYDISSDEVSKTYYILPSLKTITGGL